MHALPTMKHPNRILGAAAAGALAVCVAGASAATPAAPTADQRTTEANIARLTTTLLERSQFSHHPLDAQLASKLLDRYLDALDGARSLFLETDVAGFAAYRSTMAKAI